MSRVLSKSMMSRVTPAELESLAMFYREPLQSAAHVLGRETKVYLHWTAGHYGELNDVLSATWRRNSGSVSIAILGCFGATTDNLGDEPPTPVQIDGMAQAIAALCNGLWLTIDKQRVMTHGEAADNEDGVRIHEDYGPRSTCERWDLEYLGTDESPIYNPWAEDGTRGGDVLRGKANWYRQYWKEHGGTPG